MPGHVHECSPLRVLQVERLTSSPFLKQTFAHVRLQTARGCALQIASTKLIEKRKGGRTICCLTARWNAGSQLENSIFCHSVTCLGTNQCWNRKHMPGWFMNVPQYVLVKVQLVIRFQRAFPIYTCKLHRSVPCEENPRNSSTQEK